MSGTDNDVPVRKRRRKLWWSFWILGGALVGAALHRTEPALYRASTDILIIPQRVPEWMVKPMMTAVVDERLDIAARQILSRTRLERIVQEFDLYQPERHQMIQASTKARWIGPRTV